MATNDYEFHTKICTHCKVEYHLYFFRLDPTNVTYSSWCQYCIADALKNREYKNKPPDDGSTKFCKECGETKSVSEYYFDRNKGKYFNKCKKCENKKAMNRHYLRQYGVDEAWLKETLVKQENQCEICGVEFNKTNFKPCIDHDASTGKVRGLLCNTCNLTLGAHQENCDSLRSIGFDRHAEYLEHYKRIHQIKLVG